MWEEGDAVGGTVGVGGTAIVGETGIPASEGWTAVKIVLDAEVRSCSEGPLGSSGLALRSPGPSGARQVILRKVPLGPLAFTSPCGLCGRGVKIVSTSVVVVVAGGLVLFVVRAASWSGGPLEAFRTVRTAGQSLPPVSRARSWRGGPTVTGGAGRAGAAAGEESA